MGRCGIAIIPHDFDDYVILIECKISNSLKKLKTMSQEGLHQIERTQYIEDLNWMDSHISIFMALPFIKSPVTSV